jgi:hypothetical protein
LKPDELERQLLLHAAGAVHAEVDVVADRE